MNKNYIFAIVIMLITGPRLFAQDTTVIANRFAAMDSIVDSLSCFADQYPPTVNDSIQFEQVKFFFSVIVDSLQSLIAKYPDNAHLEQQIGEVYRMGNNLDIKGSWENAEKHLKKAMSISPNEAKPYFTLGLLYVNGGQPAKAEKLLSKASTLSKDKPIPLVYNALAFAYYYQGKLGKALDAINTYLKYCPDDETGITVRNIIESKIE